MTVKNTKTFAIIGDPIDHSLSPTIHNAAYRRLGMNCMYMAYRVRADELEEGVESLKEANIQGFNVTIPHKVSIMKYLDHYDQPCNIIGATNTVRMKDGVSYGYNTDMDGFLKPLIDRKVQLKDANVLLLGAGGSARAAAFGFIKHKVNSIRVCNRTISKAELLSEFCREYGVSSDAGPIPDSIHAEFDIVVNSTSLGMGGGQPTDVKNISPNTTVYDIVYRPITTPLLKQASEAGAQIIPGWEMLLHQAELAFEILTDAKAPSDAMRRSLLGGF